MCMCQKCHSRHDAAPPHPPPHPKKGQLQWDAYAADAKELSKAKFSSKQWANDKNQRRCKNCTANNIQSVPLPETQNNENEVINAWISAPAKVASQPIVRRAPNDYIDEEYAREKLAPFPDEVSCWICLEEKDLSSTSRPLLRDCFAGEALDGRITNVWSSKLFFLFMHILSTDCTFLAIYRLLTN